MKQTAVLKAHVEQASLDVASLCEAAQALLDEHQGNPAILSAQRLIAMVEEKAKALHVLSITPA